MEKSIYIDNNGNELENDSLLNCPFCGCSPNLVFIGNNRTKSRKVSINCCGCFAKMTNATIRFNHEWLLNISINKWNKRI